MGGIVAVTSAIAFAQTDTSPRFEVASMKPTEASGFPSMRNQPGGRFVATNISIRELVTAAFELKRHQGLRGPRSLDSRVDVIANAPESLASPAAFSAALPAMLRALLTDRL